MQPNLQKSESIAAILLTVGEFWISDGLLDQAGGESQYGFGAKRFCDWVLQHAHLSLAQQRQALVVALEAYRGDQPQRDDITVFVFRLT